MEGRARKMFMKKNMTKIMALILSIILVLSACSPAGTESTQGTTTENTIAENSTEEITTGEITTEEVTTEEVPESTEGKTLSPEEQILEDRRNAVVEAMRSMVTVLWRAGEDIDFTVGTGADEHSIKAGRVYRGMLYTYAGGTLESFLEYAGAPDKNGIVTISGLKSGAVSGAKEYARIGNDCSSAVTRAWGSIGASINFTRSKECCEANGAVKVGEYEVADPSTGEYTAMTVIKNGREVMGAAYAKLQKGDALVFHGEANHMMMALSTDVVYDKEGNVDLKKSSVTVLEQTNQRLKAGTCYYDEKLGENVYEIGGVEVRYSFLTLYEKNYLPYTCKELIDPSPIEAPYVTDSEDTYTLDSIFVGTISSNWFIDAVTITVKDTNDNVVQESTGRVSRSYIRAFDLQKFLTDPADSIKGKIDPNALAAGQYKCVVVCRLTNGQEFVAREFAFTK